MLINVVLGEECRIAIVEDGRLEEIYQERASAESHVGNIYKGRVVNVEPSIQAAFIDFGLERNGFLHITDLHPKYFPPDSREESERVGHKTPRRDRPPMQKCLRRGQEVLVQVLKEGIGTKGPTLTSYLSIPGRYLVMMPDMERLGVSRKVEDDDARREMRKILEELQPPENFGFIVRTAGIGRTKAELKRDLAYLLRLWAAMEKRQAEIKTVGELYAESDLVIRTIRDVFSSDIERIVVDDPQAAERARDFLAVASPRTSSAVMVYREPVPLFRRFGIEEQIEHINQRTVPLTSGGSLVIDSTEAVVAIDVNSGKMRENRDAETTAFRTNMEAADEICRQLRLRDLGGVIINDMIDMVQSKHRRAVETRFRTNLKKDRARTRIASISPFGILEMTRQRMRPSLNKSIYMDCTHCQGTGSVKSPESVVLEVMRRLVPVLHHDRVARLVLTISPDVAFLLLNRKRSELVALEQRYSKSVTVRVNAAGSIDFIDIAATDERGTAIDAEAVKFTGAPVLEQLSETEQTDLRDDVDDEAVEEREQAELEGARMVREAEHEALADAPPAQMPVTEGQEPAPPGGEAPGGRRRRRRRGGRRHRKGGGGGMPATSPEGGQIDDASSNSEPVERTYEPEPTTYDDGDSRSPQVPVEQAGGEPIAQGPDANGEQPQGRRRSRRRGGRRHRKRGGGGGSGGQPQSGHAPQHTPPAAPKSLPVVSISKGYSNKLTPDR